MKIIAVFREEPLQRALAAKIHEAVPLAHIARVKLKPKGGRNLLRSLTAVTLARGFRRAWGSLNRHYDETYPEWPVTSSVHDSANSAGITALIESEKPDLVLVSGTDLLKKTTLERFGAKVMNLHTGISPYIRGGPNCTNWALALGEFDLIGNTVMWIDPGVDTGAIIASERTPLTGWETIAELHLKVMDHAHDLYRRAAEAFAAGRELPAVPQATIAKGRMFLTRDWNSAAMTRAVLNHRFRYKPFELRPDVRLVALD